MKALRVNAVFIGCALLALALFLLTTLQAQEGDLKQEAADEFEKGNYPEAISLLQQAAAENPNDAEIYYDLGYYTHYLCYDSRPLTGYSQKWSDEILKYLNRAVTLNPKLGDAYYFIGAEYGARFMNALREGDVSKMSQEIRTGHEKGGYPDWLIEYARNMLKTCESDAILFVGGDAEANPIWYLQFIENYRTDVTIVPIACLNLPWYVLMLKNGLKDILVSARLSWSEEQILGMHPYKWKTKKIEIPVSGSELERLNISPQHSVMKWVLEPDLSAGSRTFLSAGHAVLADIIETNRWQRPIYFSLGCPGSHTAGLETYLQVCGLAYRLLPVETEKYGLSLDLQKIEAVLLQPEHYRDFRTVKDLDMPRASRILNNYHAVLLNLVQHYTKAGNRDKAKDILEKMNVYMPEAVFSVRVGLKRAIENFRAHLEMEKK